MTRSPGSRFCKTPFHCRSPISISGVIPSVVLIALISAAPLLAETQIGPTTADWKADAPGVRHKFTDEDLPAPFATESVDNGPREVRPPAGTQPKVPPGFKIEQYASGFSYPRYLAAAPNGDVFVTESNQGSIKLLRDTNGD